MSEKARTPLPDALGFLNYYLARVIIMSFCAFLVVAGAVTLVQHLLRPETVARVRLEQAGYRVDEASVFRAIDARDDLALIRLQTAGVSLSCRNEEGDSAYQFAVRHDRLGSLQTLGQLGISPDLQSGALDAPIADAIRAGAEETVAYLIEKGANPDVPMEPGLSALLWSIENRKPAMIELLLGNGANIHARSGSKTALSMAYQQRDFDLFDRLLGMGSQPDLILEGGMLLGVRSIRDGEGDYTRRLIEAGADANLRGPDGANLLETAFVAGDQQLFVELLQTGGDLHLVDQQGRGFLERAALDKSYSWMELLLAQGMDPNVQTAFGSDPLWWNRLDQSDPIGAELLLKAGADINAQDRLSLSPIDHAIERDDFRLTRYLFARGAETYDKLWEPLLDSNYDMVRLILANDADVNNPTSVGITPLAYTIKTGDLTGSALLMEYGARYDRDDRPGGHTLFEWALANKQLPMIELLIKQGANVNEPIRSPASSEWLSKFQDHGSLSYYLSKDSRVTPLMVAAGSHQMETARLLLENGAERYRYTRRHRTYPVTFAINSKNLPMAQLMLGREPEVEGNHERLIEVSLSEQRARFYKNGELLYSTKCSTGKAGHRTPKGRFVITDKSRLRHSTIYGSAMPYFHRLSGSAIGMHQGYVPGYPASHGCIRLPYEYARKFFGTTKVGDIIVVK